MEKASKTANQITHVNGKMATKQVCVTVTVSAPTAW